MIEMAHMRRTVIGTAEQVEKLFSFIQPVVKDEVDGASEDDADAVRERGGMGWAGGCEGDEESGRAS